ncbi:hypothetical protein C7M84_022730 [Penaeus vannamei]|uniref:Uncharacterized protein n=1 Tax=Penaeus vannamei TaxID=6689 RepID=A0A423U5V3_PENVA|nr:hypothetical protein C7M84_022730 [Penaeus vannamei]
MFVSFMAYGSSMFPFMSYFPFMSFPQFPFMRLFPSCYSFHVVVSCHVPPFPHVSFIWRWFPHALFLHSSRSPNVVSPLPHFCFLLWLVSVVVSIPSCLILGISVGMASLHVVCHWSIVGVPLMLSPSCVRRQTPAMFPQRWPRVPSISFPSSLFRSVSLHVFHYVVLHALFLMSCSFIACVRSSSCFVSLYGVQCCPPHCCFLHGSVFPHCCSFHGGSVSHVVPSCMAAFSLHVGSLMLFLHVVVPSCSSCRCSLMLSFMALFPHVVPSWRCSLMFLHGVVPSCCSFMSFPHVVVPHVVPHGVVPSCLFLHVLFPHVVPSCWFLSWRCSLMLFLHGVVPSCCSFMSLLFPHVVPSCRSLIMLHVVCSLMFVSFMSLFPHFLPCRCSLIVVPSWSFLILFMFLHCSLSHVVFPHVVPFMSFPHCCSSCSLVFLHVVVPRVFPSCCSFKSLFPHVVPSCRCSLMLFLHVVVPSCCSFMACVPRLFRSFLLMLVLMCSHRCSFIVVVPSCCSFMSFPHVPSWRCSLMLFLHGVVPSCCSLMSLFLRSFSNDGSPRCESRWKDIDRCRGLGWA